jgi:YebC/PmpR family DNA-binding regulatory protein
MSGHSKWATIKHKKGAADKARGKLFATLARQIEVAARQGGGDIDSNASLRTMVLKAKAAQMTKDAIDRAVKRGIGETSGASYESITYEGYAPGGVAVLIDVLTDNRNRTASDVRSIFSKFGGAMAEPGAVGWQFSRRGVIFIGGSVSEDDVMVAALEAGADDVSQDDRLAYSTNLVRRRDQRRVSRRAAVRSRPAALGGGEAASDHERHEQGLFRR